MFSFQHTFEQRNSLIVILCLEVIGAYVSWIDINLVANDRFVQLLVNHLAIVDLREAAADCILKIISKGMEPLLKTKLVESFDNILASAGVWQIVAVSL